MARWVTGMAALALVCGACGESPEVDRLAQAGMIGRPAARARACLGRPDGARAVGDAQIWTYAVGTAPSDA
jgi:hypothetical protein